jgi:hypothetical protein
MGYRRARQHPMKMVGAMLRWRCRGVSDAMNMAWTAISTSTRVRPLEIQSPQQLVER